MNCDKSGAVAAKSSAGDEMNDLRLGAARKRLAESRDEDDAIEGLREIVANLLGCEEIGLFRVDRATAAFRVCWSFGIDLENYDLLRALGDAGVAHVMSGECHVELAARDRQNPTPRAQAFVPMRVANQTVAILAILRLLPQKVAFDRFDMELFKLLSDEAAKPLFGRNPHAMPEAGERGLTGPGLTV